MNLRIATGISSMAIAVLLMAACSDDGTSPQEESEFGGYEDWNQVEYTNAPTPFLGEAHAGADPEFTRRIYTNASDLSRDGEYPEGTLVVKETFTHDAAGDFAWPDAMGILAMAKREAGFDAEHGDWEYLVLDTDNLDVLDSGALGTCIGCHSAADGDAGSDYLFAHPYQYQAEESDFDDYASWHLVGTEQGPDAFLGEAHAGNDENAVRKIYKKQLAANPNEEGWGHPVGTMLLKTVENEAQEIIGKTGMVKRGGDYDPANGDWEYYMWDGAGDLVNSGALGACIGCHAEANGGGGGRDYVFPHSGDPFNN